MADEKHPALGLPPAERRDYLTVVATLAAVDGVVDDAEISNIRALCKALELDANSTGAVLAAAEAPQEVDLDVIMSRLVTSQAKFSLVTDMVFLAHADGAYTEEERTEILAIAQKLEINANQVAAIEEYVSAVILAGQSSGVSAVDLKKLGGDVAAGLASAGVPIAAVAVSGSVWGLSAAGITSGLAALGLGFGMASGIGVVAAIGVGSYFGVRWLYKKIVGA